MDWQMWEVRFRRADDGGCGELLSVLPSSGATVQDVFTNGPADAAVNVTVLAPSRDDAVLKARFRGNVYGREQWASVK